MSNVVSQRQPVIGVCGAGMCDAATWTLAAAVGRLIAESNAVLVCGGLGGVMEAACQGAAAAGGLTIGILPGADARAANTSVQVAIPTNMGHARNVIIVQTADVVIAIAGEYGTLSEIALARKIGRRVIGLHTWDLGMDATHQPHVLPANSPAEAVALALQAIQ
ncbi:MAG: TIGR00725 family protein [Chloroflexaceae bacterium]|nr:TIGR00725 family protein [Chloroflexaceae bacterium]